MQQVMLLQPLPFQGSRLFQMRAGTLMCISALISRRAPGPILLRVVMLSEASFLWWNIFRKDRTFMTENTSKPTLKVGIVMNTVEGSFEGRPPRFRDLQTMTQTAEQIGRASCRERV